MTGLLILAAVLVLSTVAGLVHRSRSGRMRDTAAPAAPAPADLAPADRTTAARTLSGTTADGSLHGVLAELGEAPGERATLLQFSSAFCAPCRATRRTLSEVTELVPGVAHVEVDAEQHLELVRRLDVRKTPTTLVLDAAGREVKRASGQPRKADVLAALGHAVA